MGLRRYRNGQESSAARNPAGTSTLAGLKRIEFAGARSSASASNPLGDHGPGAAFRRSNHGPRSRNPRSIASARGPSSSMVKPSIFRFAGMASSCGMASTMGSRPNTPRSVALSRETIHPCRK